MIIIWTIIYAMMTFMSERLTTFKENIVVFVGGMLCIVPQSLRACVIGSSPGTRKPTLYMLYVGTCNGYDIP